MSLIKNGFLKTNFKILPLRLPTQFSPNEKKILPPYRRILFCTQWLFYIPQDLRDLLEFKSFLSQNLMAEAPFPDEKAGYNCLSFYSFFSARNCDNNVPFSFNSAWICLLSSLSCFFLLRVLLCIFPFQQSAQTPASCRSPKGTIPHLFCTE